MSIFKLQSSYQKCEENKNTNKILFVNAIMHDSGAERLEIRLRQPQHVVLQVN